MAKKRHQSLNNQGHGKDKQFKTEKEKVSNAFYDKPNTMFQVALLTNVERPNVCRRVAELRKENRIYLVYKGLCPISHYRAGFYTTNERVYLEYLKQQGND
ncbi:hypothetical protein [Chryseobacterium sp. A321]